MNVAMMQPAFMPWQGFFELIYHSDLFIFLDDFQFSVQSYHQRNRLFVSTGQTDWYTVPVEKASFKMPLNAAKVNDTIPWRTKMLKRMQQNYSKAPYFKDVFPLVETWLQRPSSSLSEQNVDLILLVCELMGINRQFMRSSAFNSSAQRSGKVLELLHWVGATRYYCARGSFTYMHEDGIFPVSDIEVLFQNHMPKNYSQIGSPSNIFVPYMSILDALFNVGSKRTRELVSAGTAHWETWNEMMLHSSATLEEDN